MNPTDVGNPAYYHRVVDCQWACPAHTNVPEYIRLIAHGRFTDAYLLNRESNVFPGILGRTCDRPCEPACRRTRVDGKPVAICRLKRVAADHRDEVKHLIPKAPAKKNGKKVALIGAGPASLTVANDLTPLGYQVTVFEKLSKPGGLMRINIPAFRLPEQVLDEEIGYIVDMGVDVRYNTPVNSLKALLDSQRVRRGVRWQWSAEGQGTRDSRAPRYRSDLHRHRVARVGPLRARHVRRQARPDHRRRQHRDGLLPVGEAPGRHRRQGHRPQDAEVLQGVAVGARGRRRRNRRDRRKPPADPLRHRERDADGDGVRQVQVGRSGRQAPAGGDRTGDHPVRHGRAGDRPGQRLSVHRAATSASSSASGTCRSWTRPRSCPRARRVLRRGRRLRSAEHHLGRRARPPGRHLHSQLLSGPPRHASVRRRA